MEAPLLERLHDEEYSSLKKKSSLGRRRQRVFDSLVWIHAGFAVVGFLIGLLGILATYGVRTLLAKHLRVQYGYKKSKLENIYFWIDVCTVVWCVGLAGFVSCFALMLDALAHTSRMGIRHLGIGTLVWVVAGCHLAVAIVFDFNGHLPERTQQLIASGIIWAGFFVILFQRAAKQYDDDDEENNENNENYSDGRQVLVVTEDDEPELIDGSSED
uniref:Uncharacterized protein n=1 Tax=Cyclophora tenuis TaxID=216820 RepID=A0A7S1D9E2_CYCTE|mmetsp:Transcript_3584/g.6102  ORF Transcript_3584/g.6102 Transcript_3584/m.6102 type:complete len:215 (-) Transcript_3584:44-688(-)